MDSYVTLQYADDYHSKRVSVVSWAIFDDDQKNQRLVSASDFIDANFTLKDNLGEKIKNGEVDAPEKLMNAVCEIAVNKELSSGRSRTQKGIKIDVIQIDYGDSEPAYDSALSRITNMLGDLVETKRSSLFVRVSR